MLPDVLDPAVRDCGGLHGGHQMTPAQRWARRMELLVGRLVMLEGVHLGEVVAARDLAEHGDEGVRLVAKIGVLLP